MLFKYELKIIVQTEAKNTWMILYKLIYNPLAGTRVTSPLLKWWSNCLKTIWVKQKLKWPIDLSKWDFSQFSSDQIHVSGSVCAILHIAIVQKNWEEF